MRHLFDTSSVRRLSSLSGKEWQTFRTTNSGLICDIVFSVDVDPDGNPWFGTMRGVCTCAPDGTDWRSYRMVNSGLASDIVLSIEVDYAGYVWAGTDEGLSYIDSELGVANSYYIDNSGLFSNYICSIDVDRYGNKWFGTQAGVSELLNLELIDTQTGPRVVIRERSGIIVIDGDVEIGPVLVTHKNVVVESGGAVAASPFVAVDSESEENAKLKALMAALNAVRVPAQDKIEIIKALHRDGKLYAQLIVE